MINRKQVTDKVYAYSELVVELPTVTQLVTELLDTIEELENICEELVALPKGQESHSWSDYKITKE